MNPTLDTLRQWSDAGWLRRLDSALAAFVAELDPEAAPVLPVATALLAHMEGRGHTCLPLAPLVRDPAAVLGWPAPAQEALQALWATLPRGLPQWLEALRASTVVRQAEQGDDAGQPLVLGGSAEAPLLYLRRYWAYETRVVQALAQRTATLEPVDEAVARQWLDRLFAPPSGVLAGSGVDWQKLACAMALRSRLSVITGGRAPARPTPPRACWPCCSRWTRSPSACAWRWRRPRARRRRGSSNPSTRRSKACRRAWGRRCRTTGQMSKTVRRHRIAAQGAFRSQYREYW